jgi:hypothetical protein
LGFAGPIQKSQPALNLLVEADDTGSDVIRWDSVKASEQTVASRLLVSLQNGKVVGIQQNRHDILALYFAAADLPA